jgi:hypothetical protein
MVPVTVAFLFATRRAKEIRGHYGAGRQETRLAGRALLNGTEQMVPIVSDNSIHEIDIPWADLSKCSGTGRSGRTARPSNSIKFFNIWARATKGGAP